MPDFIVTAPDGSEHVVTAPDGATPEQVMAFAQQSFAQPQAPVPQSAPQPAPGLLQGIAQSVGRGASFGLSDRAGALVSSLLGSTQNTELGDFGGTYSENLKSIQDARDKFADKYPVTDFAANLVGGVASGGPLLKGAAAVPQLAGALRTFNAMPRWAQFATGGAAAGGLSGAGNAREGDVLEGAAIGGATGAVLGSTLPPVLKYGWKTADALFGTPVRAVVNALRTPEEQGTRLLARALARDEVTPDMLRQTLNDMGPNAVVADAAGRNTLGLGDLAMTRPGLAQNQGTKFLEQRAQGAGGRVNSALQNALGVTSTNVDDMTQALHQNMRNVAALHGYDDILNSGTVELTPQLEKLMTGNTMKAAMGQARSILTDDIALGRADSALQKYFKMSDDGELFAPFGGFRGDIAERPTLRAWDYVKRGLDAVINDGTDAITGKLSSQAERAAALKRSLLQHIDSANPDYAAVRAAYADEKAGEAALNLGRAFMRDDAEVTARRLADMTPAEQQYFKAGAARKVQDMIGSRPDTGMSYADFLKRPTYVEKLKAAFGDDVVGFDAFMKQLRVEKTMGETHAALGKGTQTAARIAAAQDAGMPITTAEIPTSKMEALRAGLRYLTRPNEETSSQLSSLLLSPDPAARDRVVQALLSLDQRMNRPVMVLTPQNQQLANLLLATQAGQGSNQ